MSMDGNGGKSGHTKLIFCMLLLVGVVMGMLGQYRIFSSIAAMIAVRHRDMLATRHCRYSTWISAHLSSRAWRSSPRFWVGLSILVIAWTNQSETCSMGLQSSDLVGWFIVVTFPCCRKSRKSSTLRCGVIVLVAEVIPEMLPGKWH